MGEVDEGTKLKPGAGNDTLYIKNPSKGMTIKCGPGADRVFFNIAVKKVKTKGCESVQYGKTPFYFDPAGEQAVWWRQLRH